MAFKNFELNLVGILPMLMHNARLADPLDEITKAKAIVAGKRGKTEEDQAELARLEWLGGLYYDETVGPYLPGDNVFKTMVEAARKSKDGKRVEQGLIIKSWINPLVYKGPRDRDELYADLNYVFRTTVKQQASRIVRVRPMFKNWATSVEAAYDDAVLDLADIKNFAQIAGSYIGVGDWRPKYGRFDAEVVAR